MPNYSPSANGQRNAITQALMNVRNPPPRPPMPQMQMPSMQGAPQGAPPMQGAPPVQGAMGAPPQGMPTPLMPTPQLMPGAPTNQPMQPPAGTGMMGPTGY